MPSRFSLKQITLVAVAISLVLRIALACSLPISYKEAYFWEWAQYPSWAYLDHPPLVAILIYTFQGLRPLSPILAVRLPALVLGTACLPLVYGLALRLFGERQIALRSVLIWTSFPLVFALGTFTLPDSGQVFFQLLTFYLLVSSEKQSKRSAQFCLGVAMGCAMLSKFTFVLTLLALLLAPPPSWRRRDLLLPFSLAALLFSPFVYWNAAHHWEGLRLQLWERHAWDFSFQWWKVAEFSFEQLVAAGLPLALIVYSLTKGKKRVAEERQQAFRFLQVQAAMVLGFFLVAGSFVTQTHPHWTALAFAPAAILLAAVWNGELEHSSFFHLKKILVGTQALFLIVGSLAIAAPQLINHVNPKSLGGPLGRGLIKGKRRLLGLDQLSQDLQVLLQKEGMAADAPIYTNSYQLASPLSFAFQEQRIICLDAYTRDIRVMGHAQRYYLPVQSFCTQPGIYIDRQGHDSVRDRLERDFAQVEELEPMTQSFAGQELASYRVYRVAELRMDSKLPRSS